ncbi:SMP-30/gluconolactonase/LRE family protein [Alkalihalobacillus sp. TS-13]|uniref:SMP-30/gluconolactonase/LRE family protein n=1 Tax=Alkalihalobacillus sp. TS-13 TaxID=2842455 RepID=UPI001C87381D|nr:SMP-30/gluconolactonase/LRE family protein [Alkalihalobacillus sp. TS-13]
MFLVHEHVLGDIISDLGEGPSWDDKESVLYWVDITGKQIHRWLSFNNKVQSLTTTQFVSTVVPTNDGRLLCTLQNGFYLLKWEEQSWEHIGNPESRIGGNCFNDGKCDPQGRFWGGSMDLNGFPRKGALYTVDRDKKIRTVLEGVSCSNGITWSPDEKYMYFIDTPTRKVVAYDFSITKGTISNPRDIIYIPETQGFPDGMTSDEEGMIWIAHWGGYRVSRWNPYNGICLEVIHLPVEKVTSCEFGGNNNDELFITTAREGLTSVQHEKQPLAGRLFRVKVGIKGCKTYRFENKKI